MSGTHHSIDMTSLTQLRSIEFMILVGSNQSQWVTQILSQISSAHLEDVEFKLVFFYSEDFPNALEWNNVDAVLQCSTFSRLRNIYFRQSSQAARTTVIGHLPQCHARGILRVDEP
jgi:hypothetical protein